MKQLSQSRVLIVDDVKANVDVLVHALRENHKLSVALDGAAALRSAAQNPPDLILLDIVMPGLGGYEVCEQLKADEKLKGIPVIFISALTCLLYTSCLRPSRRRIARHHASTAARDWDW